MEVSFVATFPKHRALRNRVRNIGENTNVSTSSKAVLCNSGIKDLQKLGTWPPIFQDCTVLVTEKRWAEVVNVASPSQGCNVKDNNNNMAPSAQTALCESGRKDLRRLITRSHHLPASEHHINFVKTQQELPQYSSLPVSGGSEVIKEMSTQEGKN